MYQVTPAPIRDITFARPNKRKPTNDGQCSSESGDVVRTPKKKVLPPSDEALGDLFEGWTDATNKPMLFKILGPYHQESPSMNYIELLKECKKAFDTLKVCCGVYI